MQFQIRLLLARDGPIVAMIRARLPEAIAIYAFGNYTQRRADRESDLDLALLVAGYAEPLALWDTAGSLADVAGYPVDLLDLLDLRAAATVMQYQVITTGQRLWSAGLQAGLFNFFILNEKTALETARAPLLEDIQAIGIIHAR